MIIGVISDTHGTLSAVARDELRGVHRIVHAGDVGGRSVIEQLTAIAPVTAVRGNTDGGQWSRSLHSTEIIDLGGYVFYLLHDLATLDLDPVAAGFAAVISGHTHQGAIRYANGLLFFNPGSASHGRHGSPPSVGRIRVGDNGLHPRIIHLDA